MILRGASMLLAALVLSACAARVPVTREVVVSSPRFEGLRGEATSVVRSFVAEGSAGRVEVAGARCTLVTSLYRAEFVTPARLRLPNFGPQSPELAVTCALGGRVGSGRARIVTRWRGAPFGDGFAGYRLSAREARRSGLSIGITLGTDVSVPVSDYGNLNIDLRPVGIGPG